MEIELGQWYLLVSSDGKLSEFRVEAAAAGGDWLLVYYSSFAAPAQWMKKEEVKRLLEDKEIHFISHLPQKITF